MKKHYNFFLSKNENWIYAIEIRQEREKKGTKQLIEYVRWRADFNALPAKQNETLKYTHMPKCVYWTEKEGKCEWITKYSLITQNNCFQIIMSLRVLNANPTEWDRKQTTLKSEKSLARLSKSQHSTHWRLQ